MMRSNFKKKAGKTVLGPGEIPFNTFWFSDSPGVIISCEHAGSRVPQSLHNLGMPSQFGFGDVHYGCDLGAKPLFVALCHELRANGISSEISRAVADVNRPKDAPTFSAAIQDGVPIPANASLTEGEKDVRYQEISVPYHSKLLEMIKDLNTEYSSGILISLHTMERRLSCDSFGQPCNGVDRPEMAILYDPTNEELARNLYESWKDTFIEGQMIRVGMNEPYSGDRRHPMVRGTVIDLYHEVLPTVIIEVRNDLLKSPEQIQAWSKILADGIRQARPDLFARPSADPALQPVA